MYNSLKYKPKFYNNQYLPGRIGRKINTRVKAELHLIISFGLDTTKSVAKITSDMDKPDGLTIVPPAPSASSPRRWPLMSSGASGPRPPPCGPARLSTQSRSWRHSPRVVSFQAREDGP